VRSREPWNGDMSRL